jgi:site-specific DNA-methyltransferase (adenine-specific)
MQKFKKLKELIKNNNKLKNKIFYEDEEGILINGDINEVLRNFPNESIDLIITSPPYNVGIDYSHWKDTLSPEEYYDNFVLTFLKNFKKVLKPDGRFAINIPYTISFKHYKKGHIDMISGEYYERIKKAGLHFFALIDLVEKAPHRKKFTAWGSWLKASAPWIQNPKECVIVGYNKQWKKLEKGESTITKEEFMEIVSGLWNYMAETKGLTKANFSLDIPVKAIKGFTYKNDIVMDPFMGSGTTAIAAIKNNRKWVGIEISPDYCNIIVDRVKKEKEKK